jgi:DNA modification methylase
VIQTENATVYIGNNLDILPTLPDNSVDSIVTDPPYELGFMGKSWDSSGIAYNVDLWRECLRVLKPGGHLLSFGGTRTWHRIAVAIEDAGFEVRDSIAWMYGSGFPKSLDVSKAIDKGTGENRQRQLKFTAWMRSTNLPQKKCAELLEPLAKNAESAAAMAQHYYTDKTQPAIPTADIFDALRPYLPEVPEEIERLVAERTGIEWTAYKNREVTGVHLQPTAQQVWMAKYSDHTPLPPKEKKDKAFTPEAQQWEGWGTALKPAFEPVIVARKPLIGTVAANVLEHGTGALNIDASRIGTGTGEKKTVQYPDIRGDNYQQGKESYGERGTVEREVVDKGRWPANVILDEYSAGLLDEQSGDSKSPKTYVRNAGTLEGDRVAYANIGEAAGTESKNYGDSGGASRFFYVAKASKRDRNEGLEGLPEIVGGSMQGQEYRDNKPTNQPSRQNFHPTVKPTTLMRYLVKLVTPPGGTVLDPFTGSGSTGKAAILEGFTFIGCEMTEDYLPIIQGRLEHAEATAAAEKDKRDEALF